MGRGTTELSLALHWDGTIWTVAPTPVIGPNATFLNAVTPISATDAWAVGTYFHRSLIEHWDGTSWTEVAHPNPGGPHRNAALDAISGTGPHDVWAVGDWQFGERSLTEHWDGSSWTRG